MRHPAATISLNPEDQVAVALKELAPGDTVQNGGVVCRSAIPVGHKVAITRIQAEAPVRKYGQIIGFASADIEPGAVFMDTPFVPWHIGPVM